MQDNRCSSCIKGMVIIGDILLLNLSYLVTYYLFHNNISQAMRDTNFLIFLFLNLSYLLVCSNRKIYIEYRMVNKLRIISNTLKTVGIHFTLFTALVFISNVSSVPKNTGLTTFAFFVILAMAWRLSFLQFLKYYRRKGKNSRKFVVIGASSIGRKVKDMLTKDITYGYRFMGFYDEAGRKDDVQGTVSDFMNTPESKHIGEIFCVSPDIPHQEIQRLIEFAENNLIRIKIIPDFTQYIRKHVLLGHIGSFPTLQLRREPLEAIANRALKRAFDIVFSSFVIVAIFPWAFPIIALLIKGTSKGPLFFKQLRTGENNSEFACYKFRSMAVNHDADKKQASKDDVRITPVGQFLRKSNLDEIPQFFNVLSGEMSVVGPRPHMLKHTEEYSKIIDKYMVRHFAKPGITGWAQVNGYRGNTDDPKLMAKRVEHDIWYIENWSFLLDLKIILMTTFNMAKGEENAG